MIKDDISTSVHLSRPAQWVFSPELTTCISCQMPTTFILCTLHRPHVGNTHRKRAPCIFFHMNICVFQPYFFIFLLSKTVPTSQKTKLSHGNKNATGYPHGNVYRDQALQEHRMCLWSVCENVGACKRNKKGTIVMCTVHRSGPCLCVIAYEAFLLVHCARAWLLELSSHCTWDSTCKKHVKIRGQFWHYSLV
jgi:hypothetical protein